MNSSNNPEGLPTILDDKLINIICNMAEEGVDNRSICQFIGINEATFYKWKNKADEPNAKSIYVQFGKSLSRSQSIAKQRAIKAIWKAMDKDWHAAKYILGTRDPDYQEGRKVSLGGQEDNPILFEDVTFEIGSEEIGIMDGNPNED